MVRGFSTTLVIFYLLFAFYGCPSMSSKHRVESAPDHTAECSDMSSESEPTLSSEPEVVPAPEPPRYHVWSYLRSYGNEPKGYATYSYVLAGRDTSDALHAQRYRALVDAIQSSTTGKGDMPPIVQKIMMNIFLIPAVSDAETWNIGCSLTLVAALSASNSCFNNPGPFIVTLYHPISFRADQQEEEVTMLFVDLTNIHPDSMSEIVSAYKRRVSQAPLQGVQRLSSIKLALLNTLLIANDRIGFAKAAFADLKTSFALE